MQVSFLGGILYSLALGTMVLDSYRNPQAVQGLIGIDSFYLWWLTVAGLLCFRIFQLQVLPKILIKSNTFFVFPLSFILTLVLSLSNFMTTDNFVYSMLLLNVQKIGVISLGSLIITLSYQSNIWFKKNVRQLTFILPVIIFGYLLLIRLWPFDFFLRMVREDGVIEWLQFFALVTSSVYCFFISKRLFGRIKVQAFVFLIIACGLLFIAGDEISWGSRLFDYRGPQFIVQNNAQSEVTIHNINWLVKFTWIGYIIISFIGCFGWILKYFLPKIIWKYFSPLIPMWYISGFFVFCLIYNILAPPFINHNLGEWSEVSELMLYLGVLLNFVIRYNSLTKIITRKDL